MVNVSAFLRGRLGSLLEVVKLTQVSIGSPPMQCCTISLGASHSDRLRELTDTNTSTMKIEISFDKIEETFLVNFK